MPIVQYNMPIHIKTIISVLPHMIGVNCLPYLSDALSFTT